MQESIFGKLTTPIYEFDNPDPAPSPVRKPSRSAQEREQLMHMLADEYGIEEGELTVFKNNDAKMWNIISTLKWTDKSDGEIDPRRIRAILKKLTTEERDQLREFVRRKMDTLEKNLPPGPWPSVLISTRIHSPKLLSHVVARGESIYQAVLKEPTIVYYMAEGDYQNFIKFLK